jgi:hypothetical protein
VSPRRERLVHPLVQLVLGQHALHERGLESADHPLAVGVRGPQVTAICRTRCYLISWPCHHWHLHPSTLHGKRSAPNTDLPHGLPAAWLGLIIRLAADGGWQPERHALPAGRIDDLVNPRNQGSGLVLADLRRQPERAIVSDAPRRTPLFELVCVALTRAQHAAHANPLAACGWVIRQALPAEDCPDLVFIEVRHRDQWSSPRSCGTLGHDPGAGEFAASLRWAYAAITNRRGGPQPGPAALTPAGPG